MCKLDTCATTAATTTTTPTTIATKPQPDIQYTWLWMLTGDRLTEFYSIITKNVFGFSFFLVFSRLVDVVLYNPIGSMPVVWGCQCFIIWRRHQKSSIWRLDWKTTYTYIRLYGIYSMHNDDKIGWFFVHDEPINRSTSETPFGFLQFCVSACFIEMCFAWHTFHCNNENMTGDSILNTALYI